MEKEQQHIDRKGGIGTYTRLYDEKEKNFTIAVGAHLDRIRASAGSPR